MRSILRESQIPIPDLQHVRVRIAPEVGVVHVKAVFVGDFGDAGPCCYYPPALLVYIIHEEGGSYRACMYVWS